jgi:crotonobetainyl-CoA:carnitine CoA-transferase CaiB-like acyl-CoA transferase
MTDTQWQALVQVMGNPPWAQAERFHTMLGRKAHEDELETRLSEWTQGWEAHALMHTLQQAGVPAGVVQTNQGLIEDPQLQHRGHFVYMEHPEVGRHPVQRSEFRLSRAPAEHHWPAPRIGQHTVQVCKDILGMSEDEITALIAEDVLETGLPGEAAHP